MAAYSEGEILAALDAAQAEGNWPCFGNFNVDHLAAQLIVLRDEQRWALAFSLVQWCQVEIYTMVLPLGNCVAIPAGAPTPEMAAHYRCLHEKMQRSMGQLDSLEAYGPYAELVKEMGVDLTQMPFLQNARMEHVVEQNMRSNLEYEAKQLHLAEFEYDNDVYENVVKVTVRGKQVALSPLDVRPQIDLPRDQPFWVAVAVADQYRDQLFATSDELAKFFPRGWPPEFLVLDDWHHDDFEAPSRTETYRLLARAIATGDAGLFRPRQKPNTHWKNWILK
jgi:hypothetical protein